MKNLIELIKLYKSIIGTKVLLLLSGLTLLPPVLEGISSTLLLPLLQGTEGDNEVNNIFKNIFELLNLNFSRQNILIAIVLIISLSSSILVFQSSITAKALNDLTVKLRRQLVKDTFNLDYSKSTSYSYGYLNHIIVNEVNKVIFSFEKLVVVAIALVYATVYTIIPMYMNPLLVICILCLGILGLPVFKILNKKTTSLSEQATQKNASLQSILIQTLTNFKYLKATNKHNSIQKHINQESTDMGNISYKQNILSAICTYGFEPVVITIVASIVYYFTEIRGESFIECGVIIFLLNRGIRSVLTMQKQTQKLLTSWGSISIVKKYMKELSEGTENRTGINLKSASCTIDLENVFFAYEDKPVLKNISLRIEPETTIAFIGESGSGKSTLVNLIIGLLNPQQGSIKYGGIENINADSLRSAIGYITQENVIFNDSLKNNISLWDEKSEEVEIIKSVKKALEKAQLEEFAENCSNGLDTILGENGVLLSGGQRQRVCIARELYKEPSILVCDEATSALDSETEREIQRNIDDMKGHCTIILIAHRLSTVKNADKIFLLKDGNIVDSGSYSDLLARCSHFRKMVELQS